MPTPLTTHFTLEEMVLSQVGSRHAIDNAPGPTEIHNLRELCRNLLEPLRGIVQGPICISSGYRSDGVNALIGGAPDSQHKLGEAADLFCPQMSQQELFNAIRASNLTFDRLIDEFGAWVHVSYRHAAHNRHEVLRARNIDGLTKYVPL